MRTGSECPDERNLTVGSLFNEGFRPRRIADGILYLERGTGDNLDFAYATLDCNNVPAVSYGRMLPEE